MTDRKLITKKDTVVIIALVCAALVLLLFARFGNNSAVKAVITVDGKEVKTVELSKAENETVTLDNGIEILIENGKIGFVKSDCPDKICVKSGMLSHSGEAAACLPHKTVISLTGADKDVDAISY